MTEEKFWQSTPRKVAVLWNMHKRFNGWQFKKEDTNSSDNDEVIYKKVSIDEVPFF